MKKHDTRHDRSHPAGRSDQDLQRRMGSGQQDTQRKSGSSRDPGSDNKASSQPTRNTGSGGRNDHDDR